MSPSNPQIIARYIASDAHKHYVVVGGLNAQMEIVLPPQRVHMDRFSQWAQKHLQPSNVVVIEATTNTWTLYDVIASLVGKAGLMRLEMGEDLTHIIRGGTVRQIASVEEVRALQTQITA